MLDRIVLTLVLAALSLVTTTVVADDVDLSLQPVTQTVPVNSVGNEFEIQMLVASNGTSPQSFVVVDAIIDWDPAFLEFLGVSDTAACCSWFFSGFLPEPDGINLDLADGQVLYSALADAGSPAVAPLPPAAIVTTLLFRSIAVTPATTVSFVSQTGAFANTRVLFLPGQDNTGDITSTATVTVVDPSFSRGDGNGDSAIDIADPVFILNYLFVGGATPQCLDAADTNDDGSIDISDSVVILTYLFQGGVPLAAPFPSCGVDPTFDSLRCVNDVNCP